jgi:septal ring factor EnvC (AmiA/AmiB activator)
MTKILFGLLILGFTASLAVAQDAATQQLVDEINGRIQNLTEMQAAQGKRIDALEKSIATLQDKLNQPVVNDSASADDLQKLAKQVKELADKQQHDNDQVVNTLEKLEKASVVSATSHKPPSVSADNPTPAPGVPQKGYYYLVKSGDSLSAIAKAYSTELKTKISVEQIQTANPGLTPKTLIAGKKIFIPDPNAK